MYSSFSYKLMSCKLTIDTETIDINTDRFISLIIDNQYMVNTVPYISLTLSLSYIVINKIFAKENKVKIMIDLMEIETDKDGQILSKKSFIKKSFQADIMTDKGTVINEKGSSLDEKSTDKVNSEYPTEFILYNTNDINIFKVEENFIFKNTNPGTALTKMLMSRGVTKNVVASTPKITKTSDMAIPISDLMGNINYLSYYYGLYESFPIVYKDVEDFYVINPHDLPLKMSDSSKGIVKFNINENASAIYGTVDVKSDKNSYLIMWNTTSIIEPKINMDHVRMAEGANVISVSPTGIVKKENIYKNIAKTKVIRAYHPLSAFNAMNPSQIYKSYQIAIEDAPGSLFKPYMKYIFENKHSKDECFLYALQISLKVGEDKDNIESLVEFSLQVIDK